MILNIQAKPTKRSYRSVQSILVRLHAQHVIFLVGRGNPKGNWAIQRCHLRWHKCANKTQLMPHKAKKGRFKYSQTWAAASPRMQGMLDVGGWRGLYQKNKILLLCGTQWRFYTSSNREARFQQFWFCSKPLRHCISAFPFRTIIARNLSLCYWCRLPVRGATGGSRLRVTGALAPVGPPLESPLVGRPG